MLLARSTSLGRLYWRLVEYIAFSCPNLGLAIVFPIRSARLKEVDALKDLADTEWTAGTGWSTSASIRDVSLVKSYRMYCKYSHGTDDWDVECAAWLEDTGCGDWRHFVAPSFNARVSLSYRFWLHLQCCYPSRSYQELQLTTPSRECVTHPTSTGCHGGNLNAYLYHTVIDGGSRWTGVNIIVPREI